MNFGIIDGYLLGDPVSKPVAIEAILAERSSDETAAPFYRALEAVGARAADEALVALRLVLAGRSPSNEHVWRLRALAALARACATRDRAGAARLFERDGPVLGDLRLPASDEELATLGAASRDAYRREVAPRPGSGGPPLERT